MIKVVYTVIHYADFFVEGFEEELIRYLITCHNHWQFDKGCGAPKLDVSEFEELLGYITDEDDVAATRIDSDGEDYDFCFIDSCTAENRFGATLLETAKGIDNYNAFLEEE